MNTSAPLLDQIEHMLRLLTLVRDAPIEPSYKPEIEKYLRWSIRKAAKAYWLSLNTDGD